MAGKKRPLDPAFVAWAAEYNEWRLTVGWPKLVPTRGLQGSYFQARQGAIDHDEPFPTWEMMTAGAIQRHSNTR